MISVLALVGCLPPAESRPKPPPCPPPPEPSFQSVVVGTIGKLHLVEARYPLAKLAETMAVFKPDLVLVSARVESFREEKLEDASFETTYVHALAKARGAAIEPIDWFRLEDLSASPTPVEPADEASIAERETGLLREPKLFTFEQANGLELAQKIMLANAASVRHRAGDPLVSRRRAWLQHLAIDATSRHGRPKRVLAYVDLFDRPLVDMTLSGLGYTSRTPIEVLATSKDSLAAPDVTGDVLASWKAESERAKANAAKATGEAAAFWKDHARVLDVAVEKKGGCCVTQSAVSATATAR